MTSANTPAGIITCAPRCELTSASGIDRHAWGNNAPAMTVSQLRAWLEVVLPLKTWTLEDVLQRVAGRQQRNHRALLSHSKRRMQATPGEVAL
jgi:hypothetical protein